MSTRVKHTKFGLGEVVSTNNGKTTVRFDLVNGERHPIMEVSTDELVLVDAAWILELTKGKFGRQVVAPSADVERGAFGRRTRPYRKSQANRAMQDDDTVESEHLDFDWAESAEFLDFGSDTTAMPTEPEEGSSPPVQPMSPAEWRDRKRRLSKRLRLLTRAYELYWEEGLTWDEVADRMRLPRSIVRGWWHEIHGLLGNRALRRQEGFRNPLSGQFEKGTPQPD